MKHFILFTFILILVSCSDSAFETSLSADGTIFNIVDDKIFDIKLDNLVCDPFQKGDVSSTHGLKASLYSVQPDQTDVVDGFFKIGVRSEQEIYFSNLNVPTRSFDLGFPTVTGDVLKKDNGESIFEWFGLKIESELKLGADDEEGWYELAILSDDGSRIYVNDELVVDNDGAHETKLACGTQKFYMNRNTKLPVRIEYFQGPRYHISLIPLMRRVTSETQDETACGDFGNDLFFDSENDSAAQPAYHELIGRGWKTMTPQNWGIPGADSGNFNPCAEGEVVIMSALNVDVSQSDQIKVTWRTDKPATSQVVFKNRRTGKKFTVSGGRVLSQDHEVILPISTRRDVFDVTAISITKDLGKVVSDPTPAPLP